MKTLIAILIIILVVLKLATKKNKKHVSAPDDDSWKKNKTRTTRMWNSAGEEINPRRNGLVFDKRTGKLVNCNNPFND